MSEPPRSPYDRLFDAYNAQRKEPPRKEGGILGLFRKERKVDPAPRPGGGLVAATNAPPGWPPVRVQVPEGVDRAPALFEAAVASAILEWRGSARLRRLAPSRLHPGGVLRAAAAVEEGGVERLVFVYPRPDLDAAGHFAGARRALRDLGEAEPVYYSTGPLPPAEAMDPFHPFGAMAFTRDPSPSEEPLAAWWATGDDPDFAASATFRAMERVNVALDGIHSYVFAAWLLQHDPRLGQVARVALPRGGHVFQLRGPEEVPVCVSADAEKGIRVHFAQETPRAYREALWGHFAEYAEGWRGQVEENAWEKDPPADPHPLAHWRLMAKTLELQRERGVTVNAIGVLHTLPRR